MIKPSSGPSPAVMCLRRAITLGLNLPGFYLFYCTCPVPVCLLSWLLKFPLPHTMMRICDKAKYCVIRPNMKQIKNMN